MAKNSNPQFSTTTLHHAVLFDTTPAELFELYADARKHARVIGAHARLERRAGGSFSAWSGAVSGVNVVLRSPTLIVQAWRTEEFASDHYSILHLSLAPAGRGRTQLTLRQEGVPIECAKDIEANWHACYWEPIKQMLGDKGEKTSKRGKRS